MPVGIWQSAWHGRHERGELRRLIHQPRRAPHPQTQTPTLSPSKDTKAPHTAAPSPPRPLLTPPPSFLSPLQGLHPLNTGLAPDELADLFAYLDTTNTGHVSLDTMVHFLAPPSNTLQGVMVKVQTRFKDLASRGILPLPAFQHADEDGTGRVTRMQFKEALVDLGFVLVDEPALAPSAGGPGAKADKGRQGPSGVEEEEGGVMQPSREWQWEGGAGTAAAAAKGGKGRAATLQQKREEFEKRIKVPHHSFENV